MTATATPCTTEDPVHEVFLERIGAKPRVPRDWDVVPREWLAPRPVVRRPLPPSVTYDERHHFPVLAALLIAIVGAASFGVTFNLTQPAYATPVPVRAAQSVSPATTACVHNAGGLYASECRLLASINQ